MYRSRTAVLLARSLPGSFPSWDSLMALLFFGSKLFSLFWSEGRRSCFGRLFLSSVCELMTSNMTLLCNISCTEPLIHGKTCVVCDLIGMCLALLNLSPSWWPNESWEILLDWVLIASKIAGTSCTPGSFERTRKGLSSFFCNPRILTHYLSGSCSATVTLVLLRLGKNIIIVSQFQLFKVFSFSQLGRIEWTACCQGGLQHIQMHRRIRQNDVEIASRKETRRHSWYGNWFITHLKLQWNKISTVYSLEIHFTSGVLDAIL